MGRVDMKGIYMYNNYYTLERNKIGKYKLTLGNWTNAGWHWNGDNNDLFGFLVRVRDSIVSNDFLKELVEQGLTLNNFRKAIERSIKTCNGLYELSGDNVNWHFGQGYDPSVRMDEEVSEENLTEKQQKDFSENYFWIHANAGYCDYEKFELECRDEYIKDALTALKDSRDFEELFDEIGELSESYDEKYREYADELFFDEYYQLIGKYKKKLEGI